MQNLFLVALGGACGAVLRYLTEIAVSHTAGEPLIFTAIFIENVTGCFLIGILFAIAKKHQWFTDQIRLLVLVGFIGSYTTYSGFGLEASILIRDSILTGLGYMFIQIVTGIFAVWMGISLVQRIYTDGQKKA